MTTATEEAAVSLLPIETVVEQALAAGEAEVRQREAEQRAQSEQDARRRSEGLKRRLAELGIDASGVEGSGLAFTYGGRRFWIYSAYGDGATIRQICTDCTNHLGLDSTYIHDHRNIGDVVKRALESGPLCWACQPNEESEDRGEVTPVAERRPSIEERLYAIVREIALDAAMEAREL